MKHLQLVRSIFGIEPEQIDPILFEFEHVTIMLDQDGSINAWDTSGSDFTDMMRKTNVGDGLESTLTRIRDYLMTKDDGYIEASSTEEDAGADAGPAVDPFWQSLQKNVDIDRQIVILSYGKKFFDTPPSVCRGCDFNSKIIGSKRPARCHELRGTDPEIQRVVRSARGFEDFMTMVVKKIESDKPKCIAFYCTAGHHRSVACAELLRDNLYRRADVKHLTIKRK